MYFRGNETIVSSFYLNGSLYGSMYRICDTILPYFVEIVRLFRAGNKYN